MEDLGGWAGASKTSLRLEAMAGAEVALTLASTLVRTKQERELRCVALRNDVPGGAEGLLVPPAGVERAGGARGGVLIEQLRASIRALEQVPVSLAIPPAPGTAPPHPACSLFYSSELSSPGLTGRSSNSWPRIEALRQPTKKGQGLLDARLRGHDKETRKFPLSKLSQGGVHELQAASYRDYPAALALVLAAVAEAAAKAKRRSLVLWCLTKETAREWGRPYGPGLCALGLDPSRFLIVEARTAQDAAWALEEGGAHCRARANRDQGAAPHAPPWGRCTSLEHAVSVAVEPSATNSTGNAHPLAHRGQEERDSALRCKCSRPRLLATHARALPGRSR